MNIFVELKDHEDKLHQKFRWIVTGQGEISQLRDKIKKVFGVDHEFQELWYNGAEIQSETVNEVGMTDKGTCIVKHTMLPSWELYLQLIEKIKYLTSSGITEGRREIALLARSKLSLLDSSRFSLAYFSLLLTRIDIDVQLGYLVHNTEKYLKRSVLAHFKNRFPHQNVTIENKPKNSAGIHLAVIVFIDEKPLYYAKTLGDIPDPEEEIDCLDKPKIDLVEIFVYLLLNLTGIESIDVQIMTDVKKCDLVFISTRIIDNFYTASGVSLQRILDTTNSSTKKDIVIDEEMKRQLRILSSLLCLSDLQRNKGNYGVVESQSVGDNGSQGKEFLTRKLAIIDFKINIRSIDQEPSVFKLTADIPFLKIYFEQWDILNNIYRAKEALMTDPALHNNKNVYQVTFDRYFQRLEKALQNFLCEK